jgi:hypothetical protein
LNKLLAIISAMDATLTGKGAAFKQPKTPAATAEKPGTRFWCSSISRSELLNRRVELLERTRTTFILPAHFSVFVKPLVSLGSWSSMATPRHTFLRHSLSQELAQELRRIVHRLRNVAAELERAVRFAAPALSKGRFA